MTFKKINVEIYKPEKSTLGKKRDLIKLSANKSALGISRKLKKLNLKNINIDKYPDSKSKELRKTDLKTYNCSFDKIICGSGSDEIIQMLCQLFLSKKDEVLLPEYSFLMYRIYAKIVGAKVVFAKEKIYKISLIIYLQKSQKKK